MNYFELFGLPSQFQLDGGLLSSQFRELQKRFHPDNFATASERDKLTAVQQAARINDAYQVLKNVISRAEYLLSLQGFDLQNEQQTMQDPMFLMEQMELRETLESLEQAADAEEQLFDFAEQINRTYKQYIATIEQNFISNEWSQAADNVRKIKFIAKLQNEIERVEDKLNS